MSEKEAWAMPKPYSLLHLLNMLAYRQTDQHNELPRKLPTMLCFTEKGVIKRNSPLSIICYKKTCRTANCIKRK